MLKIQPVCCNSTGRTQQTSYASIAGCLVGMVMVLCIVSSITVAQNSVAIKIFNEENQPDVRDCLPGRRNVIQNLNE